MLREKVGLDPKKIRKASPAALAQAARRGILPAESVAKLRACAGIVLAEFGGNLRTIRDLPLPAAKRALRKFPSIGEPAAEKILLFAGIHPVFSMDSNVLRVLLRLGYGKEQKSYAASYRSVREAVASELPGSYGGLIGAYQLLRRHGQRLCRRSDPRCEVCPLRPGCAYGRPRGGGS